MQHFQPLNQIYRPSTGIHNPLMNLSSEAQKTYLLTQQLRLQARQADTMSRYGNPVHSSQHRPCYEVGGGNHIVSPDKGDESESDSYADNKSKLVPKKHYAVTSDEARHKFIAVWNSGNRTIKEVSLNCPNFIFAST